MITGTIHPLELLLALEVVTVSVVDGAFVPYSDLTESPSSAAADVVVVESSDVGTGVSAVTVELFDEVVLTVATTDVSVLVEPADPAALGVGDGVGGAVVAPASLPATLPVLSTGAAVVTVGFWVFGDGDGVTDGEGDDAGDGTGDAGAGVIGVELSELPVDVCASAAQDATTAATSSRRSERLSMDTIVIETRVAMERGACCSCYNVRLS